MSEIVSKGAHHAPYDYAEEEEQARTTSGWRGWVGFAGFLMILNGIFQTIVGLVGIFRSSFYLVSSNSTQLLVIQDVRTWGWVHLLVGIIVIIAGVSLFSGATWARVLAVLMAMSTAIAHMVSISLYPLWSLIAITLSVVVMYAVIVHGGDLRANHR